MPSQIAGILPTRRFGTNLETELVMRKLIALTLVAATVVPFASATNLLVNGSFESVSLPSRNWDLFTSVPGWTASVDKIEIGKASVYGVTGQHLNNVLELDANANATVTQTVTGLTTGSYNLSFLSARRNGRTAADCRFEVLWNNNVVFTLDPTSTVMAPTSFNLTALGGTNTLAFRGAGTSTSYGALIDNVQLAPVPEPASMAALGLGALGLIRRRQKAKA